MPQVQLGATPDGYTNASFLQVRGLTVRFKRSHGAIGRSEGFIPAVDNISFSLEKSEVVCIVGESGSGKTTVARCIIGLVPANAGSIRFDGIEVTKLKGKRLLDYRRDVQIIYQDPYESLNPRQDVLATLSVPIRRLLGVNDRQQILEIVHSLLEEVGLNAEEVMNRFPHQLSGGERQRINIARALAPRPKLLIADEPITMLDAAQKLNILTLLTELKEKRDLTILLITHDLASARLISQRTMVMYLGKLVEIADTKVILSKPMHPYVDVILHATPSAKKKQNLEENSISWIEESLYVKKGCIYYPRCKFAIDLCREVEPAIVEESRSHYAACHRAREPILHPTE